MASFITLYIYLNVNIYTSNSSPAHVFLKNCSRDEVMYAFKYINELLHSILNVL